jgi:hypothetical protein
MLAAQDLHDRLTLGIADPKLPVARAGAAVVPTSSDMTSP